MFKITKNDNGEAITLFKSMSLFQTVCALIAFTGMDKYWVENLTDYVMRGHTEVAWDGYVLTATKEQNTKWKWKSRAEARDTPLKTNGYNIIKRQK